MWYTSVSWWYLQAFFSKFWFFSKRAKNGPKWENCLLNSISQEPHIIWLSFMVGKCKMIISPGFFFHFFKILIFWFVSGIKGKKWPKMTKNYVCCALYLRNLYLLCTCEKGNISLIFFQFLIFGANSGVKGQKMTENDKKFCGCTHISVSIHHMTVIFGAHI